MLSVLTKKIECIYSKWMATKRANREWGEKKTTQTFLFNSITHKQIWFHNRDITAAPTTAIIAVKSSSSSRSITNAICKNGRSALECRIDVAKRLLFSIEYRNSSCQYMWKIVLNEKRSDKTMHSTHTKREASKRAYTLISCSLFLQTRKIHYLRLLHVDSHIRYVFCHMLEKYYWRRFNFVTLFHRRRCRRRQRHLAVLWFAYSFVLVPSKLLQFVCIHYNSDEHIIIFMLIPIPFFSSFFLLLFLGSFFPRVFTW